MNHTDRTFHEADIFFQILDKLGKGAVKGTRELYFLLFFISHQRRCGFRNDTGDDIHIHIAERRSQKQQPFHRANDSQVGGNDTSLEKPAR